VVLFSRTGLHPNIGRLLFAAGAAETPIPNSMEGILQVVRAHAAEHTYLTSQALHTCARARKRTCTHAHIRCCSASTALPSPALPRPRATTPRTARSQVLVGRDTAALTAAAAAAAAAAVVVVVTAAVEEVVVVAAAAAARSGGRAQGGAGDEVRGGTLAGPRTGPSALRSRGPAQRMEAGGPRRSLLAGPAVGGCVGGGGVRDRLVVRAAAGRPAAKVGEYALGNAVSQGTQSESGQAVAG
jgi:hypothetical protein